MLQIWFFEGVPQVPGVAPVPPFRGPSIQTLLTPKQQYRIQCALGKSKFVSSGFGFVYLFYSIPIHFNSKFQPFYFLFKNDHVGSSWHTPQNTNSSCCTNVLCMYILLPSQHSGAFHLNFPFFLLPSLKGDLPPGEVQLFLGILK